MNPPMFGVAISYSLRRLFAVACAAIAGCTASVAGMEWQVLDGGTPMGGYGTRIAHLDAQHATLVIVGSNAFIPQFWSLDGNSWTRRVFAVPPTPVSGPAIAYDSRRERLVWFGGKDRNGTALSETWEYDGQTWVRRTDVGAPPPRYLSAMTFDRVRGVIVLFGGAATGTQLLNDTFEYDGIMWRRSNTPNPLPAPRDAHSMAYDSQRQRVVMAFGMNGSQLPMNDSWEYDGSKWTKAPNQVTLTPRYLAQMTYDPVLKKVYTFSGSGVPNETRYWTGSQWQLVSTTGSPGARTQHSMAFDTTSGKILLFGGVDTASGLDVSDLWSFDGTSWQAITPQPVTTARDYSALAYDANSAKAIAFGGYGDAASFTDFNNTWHWSGTSWLEVHPVSKPPGRYHHDMAFDPTLGAVILFGGYSNEFGKEGDTWKYDASSETWTQLFPPSSPSARSGHRVVYSASHGGVLLFAGENLSNDAWVFRDGRWVQLQTNSPPPIRADEGLAYDSVNHRVIVYGGSEWGGAGADTWLLDGTTWTQVMASGPGPRESPQMAFDPSRGKAVLIGGWRRTTFDEFTWEFDGTAWAPVATTFSPDQTRHWGSAAWDPVHKAVLLAAGSAGDDSTPYNDLWAYGSDGDGDLHIDGFDNCPATPNPLQENADGDSAGDACDCAPSDAGVWAAPVEIAGVSVAFDRATLTWVSLANEVGSATIYDVLRGSLGELPVGSGGSETCVGWGLPVTTTSDITTPPPGTGLWYLVRARNVCGIGTYGTTTDGAPRNSTACAP